MSTGKLVKKSFIKRQEIELELNNCKSEVSSLIKTLNNLYGMAISESLEEDFSEFNQEFNRDLLMTKIS